MKKIENQNFLRNTLLLVLSLCFFSPLLAQPERELMVRFVDGTPQDTINAIKTEFNATELRIAPVSQIRLWRLNASVNISGNPHLHFLVGTDTMDIKESRKHLTSKTKVKTAGENLYTRNFPAELLEGLGDSPTGNPTLCVPKANITCPAGTCETEIGVIDTGVDKYSAYIQPWLSSIPGYNFVSYNSNTMDDNGHGTHVAGTIAQMADMESTYQVRIVPLKSQDKFGVGTVYQVIEALDYAIQHELDIVNMSLGYTADRPGPGDKISPLHYVINLAGDLTGMLVVCAAGNEFTDIDSSAKGFYPAGFDSPNLISVAAAKCSSQLYSFSNRGNISVDVAAPGSVHSPTLNGNWGVKSGSSQAAAVVSGLASLLYTHLCAQHDMDAAYSSVREAIIATVKPAGLPIASKGSIQGSNALSYLSPSLRKTNIDQSTPAMMAKIYPQPFRQVVNITWESAQEEILNLTIFDALGKPVYRHQQQSQQGSNEIQWDSQTQRAGTYWLTLQTGKNTLTKKMIKIE